MRHTYRLRTSRAGTVLRNLTFAIAVLCCRTLQAQEAWQTDWEKFLDELTPLFQRGAGLFEIGLRFQEKEVVWSGTLESVTDSGVSITMNPREMRIASTTIRRNFTASLETDADSVSRWRGIPIGSRVRFRTVWFLMLPFTFPGETAGRFLVSGVGAEIVTEPALAVSDGSGRPITPDSSTVFYLPGLDNSFTFWAGDFGYRVTAPEGARRLEIRTRTTTSNGTANVYVSYGSAPRPGSGSSVTADYSALGATTEKSIVITPESSPPLRPGTYYVRLGLPPVVKRGVTGVLTATLEAGPPVISKVLNSASLSPLISPGSWITVLGSNLASASKRASASDVIGNRLPTKLNDVRLTVNGNDAVLYAVSPTEVTGLAPASDMAGSVAVRLTNNGGASSMTVDQGALAPSLFTYPSPNNRFAIGYREKGPFVAREGLLGSGLLTRAAVPGETIILFATGFGPTEQSVTLDQVYEGFTGVTNPVAFSLGERSVDPIFVGLIGPVTHPLSPVLPNIPSGDEKTSGGLYQIYFVVPDMPPGDYPVRVKIGGVETQQDVFLTVTSPQLPQLVASATTLSFRSVIDGPPPASQTLSITSTAGAVTFAVDAIGTDGGAWLSGAPSAGATPGMVTVSVNPAGLAAGTYNGTVLITAAGAANSPLRIPVTLAVSSLAPVVSSYIISTIAGTGFAGSGGDGGPATAADLNDPVSVALDSLGNLYIADFYNRVVRKVSPDGTIVRFAGNGTLGSSGDGGPATAAQLGAPAGLAFDASGNLYISEAARHRIRKVTPSGVISTFAGGASFGSSGDGGPAAQALLNSPHGLAFDGQGNLYVADQENRRIRKIASDGTITTAISGLALPSALFVDPTGNVYVAEFTQVRKFTPTGEFAVLYENVIGPTVAADRLGTIYFGDYSGRVVELSSSGQRRTIAGTGIRGFSGDGGPASNAQLSGARSIAIDANGSIFIADDGNNRIRKLSPSFAPPPATPSITSLSPNSGTTGQTIAAITIAGTNLSGLTGVEFSPAIGITVSDVRASATSVSARVVIAPDASPGVRQVSVLYSGGRSNALSFSVNAPSTFTLTVTKAGTGSGVITSSPSGINCGTTCSATFSGGISVTLTAAPSSGFTFDGWSGACSGAGSCTVVLDGNRAVTASFNAAGFNGTYTGNFTGETTTTIPGCKLKQSISGTMTTTITGGTGTTSNPFSGTFTASGTDVISLISGPTCQGSVMQLSVSGQVFGSAGRVEATGSIPGLGTLQFTGGVFSGNSLTGTLTLNSEYFDQPIRGPITMTRR